MKAILSLSLIAVDESRREIAHGSARKEFDLPFAPPVGMEIETPAWKSGRKVAHVSLDLDEGDATLYLFMGSEERSSREALDALAKTYELHGWTVKIS